MGRMQSYMSRIRSSMIDEYPTYQDLVMAIGREDAENYVLENVKGEKEINGFSAKFSLTVTGEDAALFKDININSEDNVIDVVLREPAQQQLGD